MLAPQNQHLAQAWIFVVGGISAITANTSASVNAVPQVDSPPNVLNLIRKQINEDSLKDNNLVYSHMTTVISVNKSGLSFRNTEAYKAPAFVLTEAFRNHVAHPLISSITSTEYSLRWTKITEIAVVKDQASYLVRLRTEPTSARMTQESTVGEWTANTTLIGQEPSVTKNSSVNVAIKEVTIPFGTKLKALQMCRLFNAAVKQYRHRCSIVGNPID